MEPNEKSQILLSLPLDFETNLKNFHEDITKCMNDKLDKFKNDIISKININNKNNQKKNFPKKQENMQENINFLINLIFHILSNIRLFVDFIYKYASMISSKENTVSFCFSNFLSSENEFPSEIHDKLKLILKEKYSSTKPNIIFNEILEKIIEELKLNFKRKNAKNLGSKKKNFNESYKYYYDLNNDIFKIFFYVERIKKAEEIYEFTANSIHNINVSNLNNFEILTLENIDNFRQIYPQNNGYKKIQIINNILMINIIRDENKISKIIYPEYLSSRNLVENENDYNEMYELISVIIKEKINDKYIFYAFIKNNILGKWFLYDEKGKKELDDKNKIFNEQNAAFIIYQKIRQ